MSDRKCPNCGAVGVPGTGDRFTCTTCGGTFTFVAGEAKLTAVGEIDRIKETVAQQGNELEELKKRLPAASPGQQPPEDPSDNPDAPFDDDDDDDDEEDL
jgi:uncharacterized Zn finger protein (UPF0148 family)